MRNDEFVSKQKQCTIQQYKHTHSNIVSKYYELGGQVNTVYDLSFVGSAIDVMDVGLGSLPLRFHNVLIVQVIPITKFESPDWYDC